LRRAAKRIKKRALLPYFCACYLYHVHPGWRCVNAVRTALRSSAEASRELLAPLHRLPTSLTWPMASVDETLFLIHHPRPNPPLLPPHSFAIFSVQIGAFHSAATLEAHLMGTSRSKRGCNYQVAPQGDQQNVRRIRGVPVQCARAVVNGLKPKSTRS
jgi:hypothetical protein